MTLCDLLTAIVALSALSSGALTGVERGVAGFSVGSLTGMVMGVGSLAGVVALRSILLRRVEAIAAPFWREIVVSLLYCFLLTFAFILAGATLFLTKAILSFLLG